MNALGNLAKMSTHLDEIVHYQLVLGANKIDLNGLLGKKLTLSFLGSINCIQCGRTIKKTFQGGFCFPCMRRLNECRNCVIFPEKCLVENGHCPKDDWAHAHCYSSQIVYLANSSGLKVGITREKNVPSRWIDQGALAAVPIFWASNRFRAGVIEHALKDFVNDKTNWRKMLKNEVEPLDLLKERDELFARAKDVIEQLIGDDPKKIKMLFEKSVVNISYPVEHYPKTIKSHSLDKTATVCGKLQGIKGQYLLLDNGVINIAKFGGYEVQLTAA